MIDLSYFRTAIISNTSAMKRIILFTAISGLLYLSLSSSSFGPASQSLNATGSPGATTTCGNCHSGGSGTTTATVEIRKLSTGPTGPIVASYIPDTNYIIKVVGNHATLTHFGFQLTALNSSNANAGTFSNLPGNIHSSTAGGKLIVEHATQIAKTNNQFEATFHWKAPATGTGNVAFYGIINAVDNNGQVGGDKPSNPFTKALTETSAASVSNTKNSFSIDTWPNPFTTKLNLKTNGLDRGNYNLCAYDMNGRKVYNTIISIKESEQETSVNTVEWAAGIYHIQLSKEGMQQTIVVMKK
jgi:hypothetical protein